jgi:hypothetical protein
MHDIAAKEIMSDISENKSASAASEVSSQNG